FVAESQLTGQLRIKACDGRCRIVALRSLIEFPGRRFARLVRLREIAPAIPRIVGGWLQSRAGPHACSAAAYPRVEDFRQRIRSRFVVRPRCFRTRRFCRIFRLFWGGFGHCPRIWGESCGEERAVSSSVFIERPALHFLGKALRKSYRAAGERDRRA